MDVDEYLRRVNSTTLKEVSLSNLKLLQANHLKHIPFENFDIHLGKHINLSIEDAYKKCIKSHRGGYCFELNPLFSWLLKQLGYKVNLLACFNYNTKWNVSSKLALHVAI